MDNKFQKLEDKLDRLDSRLDNVERIMERNTASLQEHMKRSDLLEAYVQKEMEPIKAHVALVAMGSRGVFWFCGVVAGIAGFIYILKDLGVINL